MPALDGFSLLKAIRQLPYPQAQSIPIVAITARAIPDDEGFINSGFSAVLRKPFCRADILNAINRSLPENQCLPIILNTKKTENKDTKFNFSNLTAFSVDDELAAQNILSTFAEETQKNIDKMECAINEKDTTSICNIAHKMLPTFIMIEAKEAIPSLQWLDENKGNDIKFSDAETHANLIIRIAKEVINAINVQIKQ